MLLNTYRLDQTAVVVVVVVRNCPRGGAPLRIGSGNQTLQRAINLEQIRLWLEGVRVCRPRRLQASSHGGGLGIGIAVSRSAVHSTTDRRLRTASLVAKFIICASSVPNSF